MGEYETGDGPLPLENKFEQWGYDTRFKYYLYRVAILGNEGVNSIGEFPKRIELDEDWHQTLDRMREESRDGSERSIPFGFREDKRKLHLPQDFNKGTATSTGEGTLSEQDGKERFGITNQIGYIHTHPGGWKNKIIHEILIPSKLMGGYEGFSVTDLYNLLDGGSTLEVVVDYKHNYFAFRTEETNKILDDSPLTSQSVFERTWYRKHGGLMIGKSSILVLSSSFSLEQLNSSIAEAYNLALYKGEPGKDLVRGYP